MANISFTMSDVVNSKIAWLGILRVWLIKLKFDFIITDKLIRIKSNFNKMRNATQNKISGSSCFWKPRETEIIGCFLSICTIINGVRVVLLILEISILRQIWLILYIASSSIMAFDSITVSFLLLQFVACYTLPKKITAFVSLKNILSYLLAWILTCKMFTFSGYLSKINRVENGCGFNVNWL